MAVIKKKARRKLSKQLSRLVRKHGPEMTLALVSGIVSSLADDYSEGKKEAARRSPKAAVKTIVIRKRSS